MIDEDIVNIPDTATETSLVVAVAKDEQRAFLHRQIDALPGYYRMLISLRYQDELSYNEIASITDLPLGTVKTGLFRAKERLRKTMLEVKEML